MPKLFRSVEVRFGRPVRPERYQGRDDDRLVLRQIIDEVMYEIQSMTGQEYVDEYATKKKREPEPVAEQVPGADQSATIDLEEPVPAPSGNGSRDLEDSPPPRSSADALARWSTA
jgi:1-acyl-sn-glycerol-3-phosphate acyltransferase